MGRYYQDIANDNSVHGKFWFGCQSSMALNEIGILEDESNIYYYVYQEDKETFQEYMDIIRKEHQSMPTDTEIIDSDYEALYTFANSLEKEKSRQELANYELSLKCIEALKHHQYLHIECEL